MTMTADVGADVVHVPGVTGADFAVMSGALLGVMQKYGPLVPDPRPADVIGETAALVGPLRIAAHGRAGYSKCHPSGSHWAGIQRAGS